LPNVTPNQFKLHNQEVKVTYVTNGFQGGPTFIYDDGTVKSFKGSEVRVLQTEIGNLVSVTLQLSVDTGSTSFSVLIPIIDLPNAQASQKFHTAGIKTVHKTFLSPPPKTLIESYQVDKLEGVAQSIVVPLTATGPAGA
jgi:hypothetical protein